MSNDQYWKSSVLQANRIAAKTEEGCELEFNLLTDCLGLYNQAFEAIPSTGNGEAAVVRLALISQAMNTLRQSVYAAATGYYIQALIPLRHVYESWLSFWYLAKHPDKAAKWLTPRARPPSARELLDGIDHPSDTVKSKVRDFYGELNRFVHVDPIAAISRLHEDEGKTIIGVGVRFEADDFRACAYGIALWIGMMLDATASLIPEESPWHDEHDDIASRIVDHIDRYNSAHGGPPVPPSDSESNAP